MITYLEISIFTSPAQTLVNSVNTVGVMGKGIAATFKKLYPEMFAEYYRLCEAKKFDVGMLYIYKTPNIMIVNFPTKKHWRNPSKVEFIEAGLEKFVNRYSDFGISSVSFPQLGCGHGELNWEKQVKPVMENYLKKLPIPVYIHLYKKSASFVPERLDFEYAKQARLERQHISYDQLWKDLRVLTTGNNSKPNQMEFFSPSIYVNDEFIRFSPYDAEPIVVYREDIEDVWNILRVRGIIKEADIPETVRQSGGSKLLIDLLSQLSYVRLIRLRSNDSKEFIQGVQYVPEPKSNAIAQSDIIV